MELVIFVGLQGAGKSTFYRTRFAATHVHVSKDNFRNVKHRDQRQERMIREAWAEGKSVVVDNTNPTAEVRAPLILLGLSLGAEIIGYSFESELAACLARNERRIGVARVPDVAVFITASKLEKPSYEEGFDRLFCVRALDGLQYEVWEEERLS